jgi:hypothetical protein
LPELISVVAEIAGCRVIEIVGCHVNASRHLTGKDIKQFFVLGLQSPLICGIVTISCFREVVVSPCLYRVLCSLSLYISFAHPISPSPF